MIEILKSMSFREKSVWATAGIMIYMWSWYLSAVGPGLLDGTSSRGENIGLFIGMIIMLIVLEVIAHIILAITSPRDANQPQDERDRMITRKAEAHSSWMMGAGIITIAMFAMFREVSTASVVHLLVLLLIAVEVISRCLMILYYRRGV